MKKVLIGGDNYGVHNVGEEAILVSIINSFKNDCELSVSSYDDKFINNRFPNVKVKIIDTFYTKPKFGMYAIPRRNPIKAIKNIQKDKKMYSQMDLFICGGGTILSDCPWYSLRTIELAQKASTKSILFGVGMADIKDRDDISYIKSVCNSIEDIYVRDNFVREHLVNLGVNQEKIKVCYDPAITLQPNVDIVLDKYLNKIGIDKYTDDCINIGITLSGEKDVTKRTPIYEIKRIINCLINKYNANIFLIPTNTRSGQDIDLMRELKLNDKVILIEKEFLPEDLVAFMRNFRFVISSRLHMNILSSVVGTPSIGLVRNSKIIDFSRIIDSKYFNLDNFDVKAILEYSDYLIENNDAIRNNLINKIAEMKKVHTECVKSIKSKYL